MYMNFRHALYIKHTFMISRATETDKDDKGTATVTLNIKNKLEFGPVPLTGCVVTGAAACKLSVNV